MSERITIIEGPLPDFEPVPDGWAQGLAEGAKLTPLALVRSRSFNAPALVERCYHAWNKKEPINLHYRDDVGLEQTTQIVAARAIKTIEGDVILIWVKRPEGNISEITGLDGDCDDNN